MANTPLAPVNYGAVMAPYARNPLVELAQSVNQIPTYEAQDKLRNYQVQGAQQQLQQQQQATQLNAQKLQANRLTMAQTQFSTIGQLLDRYPDLAKNPPPALLSKVQDLEQTLGINAVNPDGSINTAFWKQPQTALTPAVEQQLLELPSQMRKTALSHFNLDPQTLHYLLTAPQQLTPKDAAVMTNAQANMVRAQNDGLFKNAELQLQTFKARNQSQHWKAQEAIAMQNIKVRARQLAIESERLGLEGERMNVEMTRLTTSENGANPQQFNVAFRSALSQYNRFSGIESGAHNTIQSLLDSLHAINNQGKPVTVQEFLDPGPDGQKLREKVMGTLKQTPGSASEGAINLAKSLNTYFTAKAQASHTYESLKQIGATAAKSNPVFGQMLRGMIPPASRVDNVSISGSQNRVIPPQVREALKEHPGSKPVYKNGQWFIQTGP